MTEYVPVARSLAARYSGRGVERGDLEQLAYLGLVKAVQRWRPGRSDDFLQFAVPTIVGEIKRYFRDHSWLVRPPRRIQELRAAISEAEQSHRHRDGSAPTEVELATVTGRDAAGHRRGPGGGRLLPAALAGRGPGPRPGPGPGLGRRGCRAAAGGGPGHRARLLETLTDRERDVVHMRFGKGWSQSRIGREIGVSQMQVSRWLRTITEKLRSSVES